MTLDYSAWRGVHVTAAALSIGLFVWRGALFVGDPARPRPRWLRIVPHVVDTVLLATALWLAWQLGLSGTRGWLPAKVTAVVLYIGLGMVALHRGRSRRTRVVAFVLAVLAFAYVVMVAITKSPFGFVRFG